MTSTIRDVSRERRLTIEADNPLNPTSVFVTGPSGLVIEFDRTIFLKAVARELGLLDPLEVMMGMAPAAFECSTCAPTMPITIIR